MHRKAKSEAKIQSYNKILRYYKGKIRKVFPNDQDKKLYKYLAEKYVLLYIWPDRGDWEEHWEDWFEKDEPTISLPDNLISNMRTKIGPKLKIYPSDKIKFLAKAYAPSKRPKAVGITARNPST